jgi:hypothetical protein
MIWPSSRPGSKENKFFPQFALNIGSQRNVEFGRLAGIHKRIELIVSTFIGVPEAMEVVSKEMRQRLGIEVK